MGQKKQHQNSPCVSHDLEVVYSGSRSLGNAHSASPPRQVGVIPYGVFPSLEVEQPFATKHYVFENSCNIALVVAALNYNTPDSEVGACFPYATRPPPLVAVKDMPPFLLEQISTSPSYLQNKKYARVRVRRDEATFSLRLRFYFKTGSRSNGRTRTASLHARSEVDRVHDKKKTWPEQAICAPLSRAMLRGGGTVMLLLPITLDSCRRLVTLSNIILLYKQTSNVHKRLAAKKATIRR